MITDLDRRNASSWITTWVVALTVALAAACSGGEGAGESESNLSEAGRWAIPADVKAVGARVRLEYDAAPRWTGTAACGGKLLVGARRLGQHLSANFEGIDSIGGYACRRNTADGSRMSVHGTGRALDIMIPRIGGRADNTRGDKIANWLVLNAQRIGVQLIIWDRTIWRANGTNDGTYGGPHPHDDHVHVELTDEGGKAATAWFSDMDSGTDLDGGASDASGRPDASRADASTDASTTTDAGPRPDAGTTTDAGATPDAGTTTPDPEPSGTPPPSSGDPPSSGYEIPENEEETERDSIGTGTGTSKPRPMPSSLGDDDEPKAASCSATVGSTRAPAGFAAFGLVFALAFLARRRR
ncbi:MAG: extensin family protein [Deltaproteobacteria bacterium]|nr:extensin family protein [Deltaproteobacteria bacterium]